jgi:hypothetical protein
MKIGNSHFYLGPTKVKNCFINLFLILGLIWKHSVFKKPIYRKWSGSNFLSMSVYVSVYRNRISNFFKKPRGYSPVAKNNFCLFNYIMPLLVS